VQLFLRLVQRGDMFICEELSCLRPRPYFVKFFEFITHLADPAVIVIYPFALLLLPEASLLYCLILMFCLVINFSLTTVLKGIGGRSRPKKILFNQDSPKGFYNEYAFPSGHTSAAFTVATCFTAVSPGGVIIWWGLAALVGLSRIYLQEHFASDVLAGGLIGFLLTALILGAL